MSKYTASSYFIFLLLISFVKIKHLSASEIDYLNENSLLSLDLLSDGAISKYFISSEPADAITAAETCKAHSKSLRLISIEDEDEFKEVLEALSNTQGIDSIWTSGLETIFNSSTKYIWSSAALPFTYSNFFSPTLSPSKFLSRKRRSEHGGYYPPSHPGFGDCNCDSEWCNERPSCEHLNCTVEAEKCVIEQGSCTEPIVGQCEVIDPQPNCTVTCPKCTIRRGHCTVYRPDCTVVSPPICTASTSNCTINPPVYEIKPGKCSIVTLPCAVERPKFQCDKPAKCTYQYRPTCPNPKSAALHDGRETFKSYDEYYKPHNCSYPCDEKNGEKCKNPCKPPPPCLGEDCHCKPVFHCVPDIICQPPPVVCPPPQYHCTNSEVVKIKDEVIDCPGPGETICQPPIVECPDVIKKCEPDIVVCPPPQTICTPAVTTCPKPSYSCSKPVLTCEDPTINCPPLPKCEIPIGCYGSDGYHPHHGSNHYNEHGEKCKCRARRSLDETSSFGHDVKMNEKLVAARCISLKKEFGFRWAVEECSAKNYFICEENALL